MVTITLADGSTQTLPPPDGVRGTNCGASGVWRFEVAAPGPHVVVTALIHGNEVCGALALWELLQAQPALQLACGSLTLVFCNLDAYARLDDANKDEQRFVDEDLNRVWGRLDAPAEAGDTYEVRRAREILPWVQGADVLLDLHSMTSPAPALGLVGLALKNVELARRIGLPALLVRDAGHAAGLRLIDSPPFGTANLPPAAMLVECGQHFSKEAFDAARELVQRTLAAFVQTRAVEPAAPQSLIDVVEAVTIESDAFEFVQEWPNMAVVEKAGTLLGRDGEREIRTPHDDTWLVMPASKRFWKPGLTAVRFGKRVDA